MSATPSIGTTHYEPRGDTEFVYTRVFDAPATLVFAAHTDPKHVPQWLLGPEGWSMPVCEIDLRPGGKWRYVWRSNSDGSQFSMHGTYSEVEAPHRIAFTEQMDDNPGVTNNIVTFEEVGGKTTMTGVVEYPSAEVRQMVLDTGMTRGMDVSYDRLDALLPALA